MIKIYTDLNHYTAANRSHLADILRPYVNQRTTAQNKDIYGEQISQYKIIESLADADICILPMSWGHYLQANLLNLAIEFIRQAKTHNKPVAIWVMGDHGINIPLQDIWEFRRSGYNSKRKPHQFALPVFINDPLPFLQIEHIEIRQKQVTPSIGFCGQANDNLPRKISKVMRAGLHNLKFHMGLSPYEPMPLYPPTALRAKALDILDKHPHIRTDFIRRKYYRAGARTLAEVEMTKQAFFYNIRDSDYTLCVRGSGNFSARLYETLALGRIPIFVDTDCILPYDHLVDWRRYTLWVDQREIDRLPHMLLDFHHSLSAADFIELQFKIRQFWQQWLSFSGFFSNFETHFQLMMEI
ncbi:exostosin family protein [Chloroflexota bacterium]